MKQQLNLKTFYLCSLALFLFGSIVACAPEEESAVAEAEPIVAKEEPTIAKEESTMAEQVEGLWVYTDLITSSGENLPLRGVFLLKDGFFLQYAAFEGDPIEEQGSMAHTGPYSTDGEFLHLVANQTLGTAPTEEEKIQSAGMTEHDIAITRQGDDLSMVFGKGTSTIQNFAKVGDGEGEVYLLPNGALALVDGQFIMVDGNEETVVAGYGSYEREGDSLTLTVNRWTDASSSGAGNIYDTVINATIDGDALKLEDGRSFAVTH
jgi:hypothetical protein